MAKLTPEQMSKIGRSNVRKSKVHERHVAHLLTDWSGMPFRRRRVEGRDATVIERESTADVIPAFGDVLCSIESKSGKDFSFESLMARPANSVFTEWWFQSCYDASLLTKAFNRRYYAMLFFKPVPAFDWVAISCDCFSAKLLTPQPAVQPQYDAAIAAGNNIWIPGLRFDTFSWCGLLTHNISHTKNKKNQVMHSMMLDSVFICRWKDFAVGVDPKSFFVSGYKSKDL